MPWQPLPLETDPGAVTARILDALAIALPGWVAREGAVEVALAEETGAEIAATNARAVDAAEAAIAGIGVSIDGLAPIVGAPARLDVDLVVNPGGGTVPAGFTVAATRADGTEVAYALSAPVTFGVGELYPGATLYARTVGAYANGAVGDLAVVTATTSVIRVAPKGPATGGIDPETRTDYLSRLVAFRSLLRPGGVRASDLALLARNTPGVARALALDLYDAQTNTEPAPKTVSLYPIDAAGAPVGAGVAAALRANIEAVREVGLLVRIGQPTYTSIDVALTATAEPGADVAAVRANIEAAVRAFLDPATWGAPTGDPRAWAPRPVVRYLDAVRAAGGASGVLFLSTLTLDGVAADLPLPGRAALPAPTTGLDPTVITASVVAG